MQMKNNMLLRLVQTAYLALVTVAAPAQNLNPTVEVSKSYEGKLLEVDKPHLKMAVPDSAYRFNLDFDYSVAETPYKGSYEFSPYSVEIVPAPSVRSINSLYLKAGVGYQLHPVLDFVWSPIFKKPFRMNVYAAHDSFVGNYWNMGMAASGDDMYEIGRVGGEAWFGYDFRSRAGVEGRYDRDNFLLKFDVAYDGLQQKDHEAASRLYNAVGVKAGIGSKRSGKGVFGYEINAAYRYGDDRLVGSYVKENDLGVDASLSYGIDDEQSGALDFGADMVSTDGEIVSGGIEVDVHPHFITRQGRWLFDVGLRFSKVFRNALGTESYDQKVQTIYPDVRIEYKLIENSMKAYLGFSGDSEIVSYSDIIGYDRRAGMNYGRGIWSIMDVNDELMNVFLGLQGRIGPRFSYDLNGGYANMGNALLRGACVTDDVLLPALGYASFEKFYASLDWLLDLKEFRFDGALEYTHVFNTKLSSRKGLFLPPALKGDVSASYNWKKRIFVGVDCEFATAMEGSVMMDEESAGMSFCSARIPAYADLGVNAEYAFNRKLSVWAEGGNLLGMTIQRSVLYAEKGPYFTVGVYLNL